MKLKELLLITLLSSVSLFAAAPFADNFCDKPNLTIPKTECEALEALWNSTGGENWTNTDGWGVDTNVANWHGITLTEDNASVDKIDMQQGNAILGNNLVGEIPDAISGLSHLRLLFLGSNHLFGNIPTTLKDIPTLIAVGIEKNNYSGALPKLIGLNHLVAFYANENNFTGTIPKEYNQFLKLKFLILYKNHLSGAIPDFSALPLEDFEIYLNHFTFSDIEPQMVWIEKITEDKFNDVYYSNQYEINETGRIVYFDDVLTIEPSLGINPSGHDNYSWFKETDEQNILSTERIYEKHGATIADEGYYTYEVNNTIATIDYYSTDLRLYSSGHSKAIPAIKNSKALYAKHDNTPKVSNKTPLTQTTENTEYTYTSDISDADSNDTLKVTATALPAWLTLTSEANNFTLSGIPTGDDLGSHDINLTITDGKIPVHINYTLVVKSATQPNHAPTITGTPKSEINVGEPYTFTPTAKDEDSDDTLTYTITNKPSWATFDPATGRLSGTPQESDVKSYTNITITVSDSLEKATLPAFSINVKSLITPNTTPSITGTPDTVVNAKEPYSFTPTAKDKDGDTLTYSITHKPSWASFNASTGALTGTPQESDVGTTANIIISVSDTKATASLPAFSINVRAAGTVTPPPPTSPVKSSGGGVNPLGFGLLFVLFLLFVVGREGSVNKVK